MDKWKIKYIVLAKLIISNFTVIKKFVIYKK